ncbi:MAG: hypothetical protein HKN43_02955 [Rhodothermales bacterium]|nr:hypothetical protein [Rhodothermales bacterium]
MSDLSGHISDDNLLLGALEATGWHASFVPWDQRLVRWADFDCVVVRSTWDYHKRIDEFTDTLRSIDASTLLINPLEIMLWNTRKTYLREISQLGLEPVPTLWTENLGRHDLTNAFHQFEVEEIIVKPVVGANSDGIHRISSTAGDLDSALTDLAGSSVMIQPFVRSIATDGEISLMYFNGFFSHAVRKRPRTGDFRSQQEHGAAFTILKPEDDLVAAGAAAIARLPKLPLYARLDFLPSDVPSAYWLVELELIEPSLFFTFDDSSPNRFAHALNEYMDRS